MISFAQHLLLWLKARLVPIVSEESGQGTTEYALLVGLLVVVAIVAIVAVGPVVQGLWDSIQSSMETVQVQ